MRRGGIIRPRRFGIGCLDPPPPPWDHGPPGFARRPTSMPPRGADATAPVQASVAVGQPAPPGNRPAAAPPSRETRFTSAFAARAPPPR